MSIKDIHEAITKTYNEIETIAKENPLTAIIYSVALKTFSVLVGALSNCLGFSIFLFSLCFDIAIMTNLNEIYKKIENTFMDITQGVSPEERNASKAGYAFKTAIARSEDKIKGFFNGLFAKI